MGKQFTAVNQDSKIVNQGFPIKEIIGSHQEIPITIKKIQVNILSKNLQIVHIKKNRYKKEKNPSGKRKYSN